MNPKPRSYRNRDALKYEKGATKMKKLNAIVSIVIVMALMAGSVLAAEEAAKPDKDKPAQAQLRRMRSRGAMGMGHGLMMRRARGMGGIRRGAPTDRAIAILRLANQLKLSEAQRRELSELISSHKKAMIKQRAERDIAKVDLQKLMKQQEPDVDEVRAQLMDIAEMEVEMKCARIRVGIAARNVLTEEQQTALKKILRNRPPAQRVRARRGAGKPTPKSRQPGR
jgi:Spy/CpxP family protein refolding chaperone